MQGKSLHEGNKELGVGIGAGTGGESKGKEMKSGASIVSTTTTTTQSSSSSSSSSSFSHDTNVMVQRVDEMILAKTSVTTIMEEGVYAEKGIMIDDTGEEGDGNGTKGCMITSSSSSSTSTSTSIMITTRSLIATIPTIDQLLDQVRYMDLVLSGRVTESALLTLSVEILMERGNMLFYALVSSSLLIFVFIVYLVYVRYCISPHTLSSYPINTPY